MSRVELGLQEGAGDGLGVRDACRPQLDHAGQGGGLSAICAASRSAGSGKRNSPEPRPVIPNTTMAAKRTAPRPCLFVGAKDFLGFVIAVTCSPEVSGGECVVKYQRKPGETTKNLIDLLFVFYTV